MSSDVVLKVNHVSKSFKLPTEQSSGIKQAFINWTKGIKGYKMQHCATSHLRWSGVIF